MRPYTLLETLSSAEAPVAISEFEQTEGYAQQCRQRGAQLMQQRRGAAGLVIRYFSAILPEEQGILIVNSRAGSPHRTVALFTSEFRRDEYVQILFPGVATEPLSLSLADVVSVLGDLREAGTSHVTLDRCPRRWTYEDRPSESIFDEEAAAAYWCEVKGRELTLADCYHEYVVAMMEAGKWEAARDAAIMAVAYVSGDDSRFHAALVTIGRRLTDGVLVREAEAALALLHGEREPHSAGEWIRRLGLRASSLL